MDQLFRNKLHNVFVLVLDWEGRKAFQDIQDRDRVWIYDLDLANGDWQPLLPHQFVRFEFCELSSPLEFLVLTGKKI